MIWILRKQDISEVLRGENNDQLPARGSTRWKGPFLLSFDKKEKEGPLIKIQLLFQLIKGPLFLSWYKLDRS